MKAEHSKFKKTCVIRLTPASSGRRGGVPMRLYELVRNKFPEYSRQDCWGTEILEEDHPKIPEILEYFKEIGIAIPTDHSAIYSGVLYTIGSTNSKQRKLNSEFTSFAKIGPIIAEIRFVGEEDLEIVNSKYLTKGKMHDIGGAFAFPNIVLVRGEMKRKLEDLNILGLSFRELDICNRYYQPNAVFEKIDWPKGIEPLYQLYSNIELPVCKNWMYDNEGRVFHPSERGRLPDGCIPSNGPNSLSVLHYAEAEIKPFLDYDFVRTYEIFQTGHAVLCSKKARDIFKLLGVKSMEYHGGLCVEIDQVPWIYGVEGGPHPRYSGRYPNAPVD